MTRRHTSYLSYRKAWCQVAVVLILLQLHPNNVSGSSTSKILELNPLEHGERRSFPHSQAMPTSRDGTEQSNSFSLLHTPSASVEGQPSEERDCAQPNNTRDLTQQETAERNENRRFIVHYESDSIHSVLRHLSDRNAKVVHHMHEAAWVAAHGTEEIMQHMKQVEGVTHVELDAPRQLLDCCKAGTFRIQDKTVSSLKGNETTSYGLYLTQVARKSGQDQAGRLSTLDSKVVVCIIDSGVDARHPDLAGNRMTGCSKSKNCPFTWNRDKVGHGTFVAGVLGAGQNGFGTVGIIPRGAALHIVRIFNQDNTASGPYSSNVVAALNECEQHLRKLQRTQKSGYRMIINMSFGDYMTSKAEQDWFASRSKKGDMIFVAAAGNLGPGTVLYPASYPEVISVAAVDCQGQWIQASSVNGFVDIAAPGASIVSTAPMGIKHRTGTMFADDSEGVSHYVELQSVWSEPTSVSGQVVVCQPTRPSQNATACPGVKGKVCLVQLANIQDMLTNAARCKAGGAKAAIFYDDPAICNPPGSVTFTSSKEEVVGGGTMTVTFGSAQSATPMSIPAVGVDASDGAMMESYIRNNKTFSIRLTVRGGGPYQIITGTSAAAPFVSGIAARVWAAHPFCNASEITRAMYSSAMDTMLEGYDTYSGHGIIQAVAFKALVAKMPCARKTSSG